MHKIDLPQAMRDRADFYRGGEGAVDLPFDPAKTAHLIVDLQKGFMEEGAPAALKSARAIVPNVNKISQAVRAAGGKNIFLRWTSDGDGTHWRPLWDIFSPTGYKTWYSAFEDGSHYHSLWDGLDRTDDELIVNKSRYSPFIPGTSDLPQILKEQGIENLVITGCVSNCCSEATARDAMQNDFKVFFIEDGNAAFTDEEHNATLISLCTLLFSEIISADDMIEKLGKAVAEKAA